MSAQDSPTGIISQQVFDQYSSKWVEIIGNSNTTLLNECFKTEGHTLAHVTFPALQIARLVSTVGARHIKARFLVATVPQGELLIPHFTLALFATDDLNARLSSYYLADAYWKTKPTPPPTVGVEIPKVLVDFWLNKWTQDTAGESAITLDDFLSPLAQAKDLNETNLKISFGLHEFYRTGTDGQDALNYTFGLVVQFLTGQDNDPIDDPSFDMSQPCPPTC